MWEEILSCSLKQKIKAGRGKDQAAVVRQATKVKQVTGDG